MANIDKKFAYGYQPLDGTKKGAETKKNNFTAQEDSELNNREDSYELDDLNKDANLFKSDSNNNLHVHGIGVLTAGIFIIGEICGAGVVAFPGAMSKTGWGGLPIMFLVLVMCIYCGLLLGYAWKRVNQQRTTTEPIRDPYPYIGEVAAGKGFRHAVTFCLNLQIFLTCVIYLLLCAEILHTFVSFHIGDIHSQAGLRLWLAIITVVLLPFTWLGTPKDFWFVAVGAALTTTVAVVLIFVKYALIAPQDLTSVEKAPVTFRTFSSAYGAMVFGFTGASLFPTIQADMKSPDSFSSAAFIGYFGIALLYIPTAIGGYLTIGKDLQDSILKTLTHYDIAHNENHTIVAIVELLFASHFLCGFVLMINPLMQQMENFFNLPHKFSMKRLGWRTLVVLCVLVTAEIFPQFGPIVDLVGGSINVLLCFIFPIVFYVRLYPETPRGPKIVMAVIVVLSLLGAVSATIFNILNLKDSFYQLYLTENSTGHPT